MLRKYIYLLLLALLPLAQYATPTDSLPRVPVPPAASPAPVTVATTRSFATLPATLAAPDPLWADEQPILQDTARSRTRGLVAKAKALREKIKSARKFIQNLDPNVAVDLPVGIRKVIGNTEYIIAIDSIVLTPTGAYLSAYLSVEVPTGQTLTFRSTDIRFSQKGGFTGEGRLLLVEDVPINPAGTSNMLLTLLGGATYAKFDCNGFKGLGIGARVDFSRDLLEPLDDAGNVKPLPARVSSTLTSEMEDWSNLLFSVSLPRFQIRGVKGFDFEVNHASFDMSEVRNPDDIVFPRGYSLDAGAETLWRGLHIKSFRVTLPSWARVRNKSNEGTTQTTTYTSDGRPIVEGLDVIVDGQGVSGTLRGSNIFSIEQGSLSGWGFSLTSIQLSLTRSSISGFGFAGQVRPTIMGQRDTLAYSAIMSSPGEYVFTVVTKSNISFPSLKAAKVALYKNSSLELRLGGSGFAAVALLNGRLTIGAGLNDVGSDAATPQAAPNTSQGDSEPAETSKGFTVADITFEGLRIATVKPFVGIQGFSVQSDLLQKLAAFPISIDNIAMKRVPDSDDIAVAFDLKVNLVGKSAGAFAATGRLAIIAAHRENAEGSSSFAFKGIELEKLEINIDQGGFKLEGFIAFYKKDEKYGNGFQGLIKAEFTPGIKVNADAIFGNVRDMRYWLADAAMTASAGIPIVPGLGLYGFGGGAYYKMKSVGKDTRAGNRVGKTSTGIVYEPDENTSLGIKAFVGIGTHPLKEAFTGDAMFEVSFSSSGGLSQVIFKGNGYMAVPPGGMDIDKVKKAAQAVASKSVSLDGTNYGVENTNLNDILDAPTEGKGQISASLYVQYDANSSTLIGDLNVKINLIGGVVNGGGRASFKFSPSEWYILIGRPERQNRIQLSFLNMATLDSYLMVGSAIPGSPPPPPEVSEILGGQDLDYMRDENALKRGGGFAFGASFRFDTGKITFLIFYAQIRAGVGFDLMLRNYGPDVRCAGRNEPIGINGWYANGQVYAYLQGSIGLHVDFFFYKADIEVLSLGLAAVLQAKLPNPTWMRGIVGGYYSVLGGLVRGNCHFEFTLGEECRIVGGSVLSSIKIISELTPKNDDKDVSVFTSPQAIFNMPVNKEFSLVDVDNQTKTFRATLEKLRVLDSGREVQGSIEMNDDNTTAAFQPFNVMPPQKKLTAEVRVVFELLEGGQWKPALNNGKPAEEVQSISFVTGDAPDCIPEGNVLYSYPAHRQFNFYPNEASTGYITLKIGQPYLFEKSKEWRQIGRFYQGKSVTHQFDITYSDRVVRFTIPDGLRNDELFSLQLIKQPIDSQQPVDINVAKKVATISGTETSVTTRAAEGTLTQPQEKSFYESPFRVSYFNTLDEKLRAQPFSTGWRDELMPRVYILGAVTEGREMFDKWELKGHANSAPLIQFEAVLMDNSWYSQYAYPVVYDGYPLFGRFALKQRDEKLLGVPPIRAVGIYQSVSSRTVTDDDIVTGRPLFGTGEAFLNYNLGPVSIQDFQDLRAQAINSSLVALQPSARLATLMASDYPYLRPGNYKLYLRYYLPGAKQHTSERLININNPVGP